MPPEPTHRPSEAADPADPAESAEDSGLRDGGFSGTFAKGPGAYRRGLLPGKRVWIAIASAAAVTGLVMVTVPLVGSLEFGSDGEKARAAEAAAADGRTGGRLGTGTETGSTAGSTSQKEPAEKQAGGSAAPPSGTGPGAAQRRYDASGEFNPWAAASGGTTSGGAGLGSGSTPPRGAGTGGGSGNPGGRSATAPAPAGGGPKGPAKPPAGSPSSARNVPVEVPRPPKLDDGKIKGPVLGFAAKLCIDVVGGKVTSGASLMLATCSGERRQRFEFRPDGQVWTLYERKTCMDLRSGATADGTAIKIVNCNGSQTQVFRIQKDGSLVNPRSNKCVEAVEVDSRKFRLQLHTCDGAKNQKWQIG
ncbi:RICIN domain-containing protein [Streptomyces sp. NPDC047315]|uniref:RICIN domain-containing protein n=1 Tax=Streptomyces sp. NPDC047315 TaxID=3155142 RepID=UPI0034003421